MLLYFIGLGLYDEMDVSLKGAEALKKADIVYAEFYTAQLFGSNLASLKKMLKVEIEILSREQVEEEDTIIESAKTQKVAFLSVGDPLIATTHTELMVEAFKMGIETRVIHSSSILSAAPGLAGLQAYKFGKVTTIPFPEENYFPHSPYLAVKNNLESGLHSLVLLDIQTHRNKFMTANEGLNYLLRVEKDRKNYVITKDTVAVVIARAGAPKPLIRADKINKLLGEDFGGPLHSLIIPGQLHFMEAEALVVLAGAPAEILNRS